jgi:hypothetical protein
MVIGLSPFAKIRSTNVSAAALFLHLPKIAVSVGMPLDQRPN